MKDFLITNEAVLTEFSASYFQTISSIKNLKNASAFLSDAVSCGVALAIRQVLIFDI
jgi:hypothetical protein